MLDQITQVISGKGRFAEESSRTKQSQKDKDGKQDKKIKKFSKSEGVQSFSNSVNQPGASLAKDSKDHTKTKLLKFKVPERSISAEREHPLTINKDKASLLLL